MTFNVIDQTPESQMDNSEITQMFDMTQNKNVINGNLISQPDTEESDAGVCLACGSQDGSDVNDKIDISKNKGLTPQKIVQTSTVVHEKPKPVKSRFFINGGKLGIPYFYQCKYYKVQMFIL